MPRREIIECATYGVNYRSKMLCTVPQCISVPKFVLNWIHTAHDTG